MRKVAWRTLPLPFSFEHTVLATPRLSIFFIIIFSILANPPSAKLARFMMIPPNLRPSFPQDKSIIFGLRKHSSWVKETQPPFHHFGFPLPFQLLQMHHLFTPTKRPPDPIERDLQGANLTIYHITFSELHRLFPVIVQEKSQPPLRHS